MTALHDVLIIGAGPAGLALAAACGRAGLDVAGLAPQAPDAPWSNTYGIWEDELSRLDLPNVLGHRWDDCVVYVNGRKVDLNRRYGLFDNRALQHHLLAQCHRTGVRWQRGFATQIDHENDRSVITTRAGQTLTARVVVDASGHDPVFVRRPLDGDVAYQAAYGIVGTFSSPPVASGQLVLMDYGGDHLTPEERRTGPPTFLYAMDLGDGRFFVEETSLARAPAVPLDVLQERLHRRLAHAGSAVAETEHVERCLFPMNLPLPALDQPVLGYGGAASMVHPATGYQVGAALKRAPVVAAALARVLDGTASPAEIAQAGWQAVWPPQEVRKRSLYLFGLRTILQLNWQQTNDFFDTFFQLPHHRWTGYLSNTLSATELLRTMLRIFGRASPSVRWRLVQAAGREADLLWRGLRERPITPSQ